MRRYCKRIVLIGTVIFSLLCINITPTRIVRAAAPVIAAGQRVFVSYLATNPIPLFTRILNQDGEDAESVKERIITNIPLGMPLWITWGPEQAGNKTWWRVRSFMGEGWVQDTVEVNGKVVPALATATEANYNSIITALNGVIKKTPSAEAFDQRGLAYFGLTFIGKINYEAALADFSKAVELDPQFAWAHAHKGYALWQMNRYSEALTSLTQAIELNKDEFSFWHLRMGVFYDLDKYEATNSDAYDGLNSLQHRYPAGRYPIADYDQVSVAVYWDVTAGVSPQVILENIVAPDAYFAKAWSLFAQIMLKKGKLSEAYGYYQKAIDAEPASAWPYVARAYCEIECNQQFEKAEADIKQAIAIEPGYADSYFALGYVNLVSKNDVKAALEYFKKASQLNPYNAKYHREISDMYRRLKQYDKAIATAQKAIDISPEEPCACGYFYLANAYEDKQDYKNAVAAYQKYLQLANYINPSRKQTIEQRIEQLNKK